MHDWGDVASNALVDIFPGADEATSKRPGPARQDVNDSKDCQMNRL
jgi:hypothetical protein